MAQSKILSTQVIGRERLRKGKVGGIVGQTCITNLIADKYYIGGDLTAGTPTTTWILNVAAGGILDHCFFQTLLLAMVGGMVVQGGPFHRLVGVPVVGPPPTNIFHLSRILVEIGAKKSDFILQDSVTLIASYQISFRS